MRADPADPKGEAVLARAREVPMLSLAAVSLDPQTIVAWCSAIGAMAGVLTMLHRWEPLRSRLRLSAENTRLREENVRLGKDRDELRGMLRAFESGLTALNEFRDQIDELRRTNDELRLTNLVTLRYLVDIIQHVDGGGTRETMPPLPDELRDEVLNELRRRIAADAPEPK